MESRGPSRCWAIVPAAGHSRRMGRHKLLLDIGGRTVIARLAAALVSGGVDSIEVLVRHDDAGLRSELERLPRVSCWLTPDTPDMRASVETLLMRLAARDAPADGDRWLLCPADHPLIDANVVSRLLAESARRPEAIHLPTFAGQRGHPTVFPWSLGAAVRGIPGGEGLNWLVRHSGAPVLEHPLSEAAQVADLDTPEDYQRLRSLESLGAAPEHPAGGTPAATPR